MKKSNYFILLLVLLNVSFGIAQPSGYYNGTENKQGDALKSALNDIISDHTVYSYFFSKEIFKLSDADPANPDNIIQIYTGKSWPNDDYGSEGNQLNREHIWAKSHGNFDGEQPMDGDVHNLKPCDASVNIDKSNLDYDNGGTAHPEAIGCYYDGDSWEPRDADKGDVARIIFYMDIRYEGENGEINLTAVDEVNTYPYPEHGKLSTLLQWNLMDPPDEFERNRNNVIYSFQHNRNPFIDNPYFAELIWNNGQLNPVSIGNVHQDPQVPHANDPITISADISSTAGSINSATLKYGTSWGSLGNSINMSGSGNVYTGVIPGQNQGTTVYYQVMAQDGSGNTFSSVIYNFYVPLTFTGTLTSVYDIQGQGASSPFVDQVVSTTGIVTANFGTGYFIQDGSGPWNGLYIYDGGRNPSVGDSIIITGTITEYYEKTELKTITGYYYISSNHQLPAPANISCVEAGEPYEGVLVRVDNATCTDVPTPANYYMWTVNDGTGNLRVHNTNIFEYEPTQGEVYTVSGPLDYDFDEWKIQLRLGTDVITGGGDVTAPEVLSVEVVTSTIVKIQFSEPVNEASAQLVTNYSINNSVTVQQAAVHAIVKSQVFLTVSPMAGGSYELTVQNVADLVGNAMPAVVLPFISTGINEVDARGFMTAYPNPALDKINIEWISEAPGDVTVSLYGIAGSKAYSGQFVQNNGRTLAIDVKNIAAGLYILEVKGNESIARTKVMIR